MPQGTSQFLQVFFEETEEYLATLELLPIGLDLGRPDSETLHGIFRTTHSIKGSSGVLGFDNVTSVIHELETLLDRIRCGQMGLRPDMISSFLEARDVLQRLLNTHRSDRPDPGVSSLETVKRLRGWLRASEQEAAEEGFGLFNDAPTSPTRETANDDALGFFNEGPGTPERAAAPEVFRLFDEAPGAPAASGAFGLFGDTPGSPPTEKRVFGLFDGAPGNPAAPSTSTQTVTAPAKGAVAPVRGDGESGSIRVSMERVDSLVSLVGELMIAQAMFGQFGEQLDPNHHGHLQHALARLEHNTRDLQESVMSVRILPINFIFSRFPRLVRDTAARLSKQIELYLHGEHTELNKSMIEKLNDSFTHIVRNSINHGTETPTERLATGKPASGTMKFAANHRDGSTVMEVSDDDRGLSRPRILVKARGHSLPVHDGMNNTEIRQLMFMPGFSIAEAVTELSGHGAGIDVVKRNIGAMNGRIDIDSAPSMGTRIGVRLPLTLAILGGLIVAVEAISYAIPLTYIVESLQVRGDDVRGLGGEDSTVIHMRGEYLSLFSLHELLRIGGKAPTPEQGIVIILESEERSLALQVGGLVGQQQVMTRSLEQNFRRVEGIAGTTIMGDGSVALILGADTLPRLATREDTADEQH